MRPRFALSRWFSLLIISGCCIAQPVNAAEPTSEELNRHADRCRELLGTSVIDFYLPGCVDQEHGGYLEELDANGKFRARGEKFLTLQARQMWFFSVMAENEIRRDECLAAARSGYEFLQQHFYDADRGGYFSRVKDDGTPVDRRKHAYLNSFALYGLAAYSRAAKDDAALQAARDLFAKLEEHAYDREHGGYQEFFYEDWRPITDPQESPYVGAIGTKTYNTHLHLLESFAELQRTDPDDLVARRLAELIEINTTTVQHPDVHCNIDGWSHDWTMIPTPQNIRASYGHDVECAWLVLDAGKTLDRSPDLLRQWAISLCGNSLEYGYDNEHGGFYYTGNPGLPSDDTKKEWWVQSEALVSMLDMYTLTGDERYYQVFGETLEFVEKYQIAKEGGWWATRAADGSATNNRSRTSMWQGAYHNGRALLLCSQRLKELAKR